MISVFTSYHHKRDQFYKEELCRLTSISNSYANRSVELGDISEELSSEQIRRIIRDQYLRQTTVTVLLVGTETRFRKHVDWELKSSMIDGEINQRSGIVVVTLPEADRGFYQSTSWQEQAALYPDITRWEHLSSRTEYERRFPFMPARIVDNMVKDDGLISVTSWDRVMANPAGFNVLVQQAHERRLTKEYCLKRQMRRSNHNPFPAGGMFGFGDAVNALAPRRR